MLTRSLSLFALLILALGSSSASAQMTVYNSTPDDVWVWVATYNARYEIISGDASVISVTPARAQVDGPWKLAGYGGFANIKNGRHILVVGPGRKRQDFTTEPKDSLNFPFKKEFSVIKFDRTFQKDPYADSWAGWAKVIGSDDTLVMRTFIPVSYFKDDQGRIRITNQKLGW
jgi:hypothetical protein